MLIRCYSTYQRFIIGSRCFDSRPSEPHGMAKVASHLDLNLIGHEIGLKLLMLYKSYKKKSHNISPSLERACSIKATHLDTQRLTRHVAQYQVHSLSVLKATW